MDWSRDASWVALASADLLWLLRYRLPSAAFACAAVTSVSLVFAGSAGAGLRPDPPKLPQPPPPPPKASLAPPPPEVAPPPPAPLPSLPPPPARTVLATPNPAPAGAARRTSEARVAARARAARARARQRRVRSMQAMSTDGAKPGAVRTQHRRPSPLAHTFSNSRSDTTAFVGFASTVLLGVLLLGAVLIPADVLPWPEPARVFSERRDELTFAGLAMFAASAVGFLLLFMA
jgi:hypothetical protein